MFREQEAERLDRVAFNALGAILVVVLVRGALVRLFGDHLG